MEELVVQIYENIPYLIRTVQELLVHHIGRQELGFIRVQVFYQNPVLLRLQVHSQQLNLAGVQAVDLRSLGAGVLKEFRSGPVVGDKSGGTDGASFIFLHRTWLVWSIQGLCLAHLELVGDVSLQECWGSSVSAGKHGHGDVPVGADRLGVSLGQILHLILLSDVRH